VTINELLAVLSDLKEHDALCGDTELVFKYKKKRLDICMLDSFSGAYMNVKLRKTEKEKKK